MNTEKLQNINVGNSVGGGNLNTKNMIEDYMKNEYEEGLRNEFNMMDALINRLPKKPISGKKLTKSFALGITDNIRAVGSDNFDNYELEMADFEQKGADTVEAEFDTTKLMATFSITDEALLKGTGDGSIFDVLADSLNRMEIGLKHTYNRYIYGGKDGIIGEVKENLEPFSLKSITKTEDKDFLRDNRGQYHNYFYKNMPAPAMYIFSMTNSHSLIEGMGCMIQIDTYQAGNTVLTASKRLIGRIWQKDNTQIHSEKVIFIAEQSTDATVSEGVVKSWGAPTKVETAEQIKYVPSSTGKTIIRVFSRQLNAQRLGIAAEYQGLEDIVVRQNNFIFGVDRSVYRSLNCTGVDMEGTNYLNEEILRDLSDHLALTSPEGTNISLVCANHRIISTVEKSMYQFKNYNLDSVQNGVQLGGHGDIRFDNFVLVKDKYARDNNVYMLDQAKIGELVRRDFQWITTGEVNGVLQRRDGTEMYEGIMNKYADMYIDAWRCHAVIKNCAVPNVGSYLSYGANGLPKSK